MKKFLPRKKSSLIALALISIFFFLLLAIQSPSQAHKKILGTRTLTISNHTGNIVSSENNDFFLSLKDFLLARQQAQKTQAPETPSTQTTTQTITQEAPKTHTSDQPTQTETIVPAKTPTWADTLVQMTNDARVKNGLPALTNNPQVAALATKRSEDMATKNYFSHTSPTGETAFTLLKTSGITYKTAGENIGQNNYPDTKTVQVVFDGWMASPGHKANILKSSFTSIGIGTAVDAKGMKYFTQIFIGN